MTECRKKIIPTPKNDLSRQTNEDSTIATASESNEDRAFCRFGITKQQLNTAKQLGIAAAVCLFSIYALFLITDSSAKASEKAYLVKSLAKVLPPKDSSGHSFDNDLLKTQTKQDETTVYQACKNNQPKYQIYEIKTDKGYSGIIKLLVSVDLQNKEILQSRPLFHQETPGLGDQIDTDKSPWLKQFALPLQTPKQDIAVKQDKGKIDAITGATITSRAVSNLMRESFFTRPLTILPNKCN